MKTTARIISVILAAVTVFCALPITALAGDTPTLTVSEKGLDYAEITWNIDNIGDYGEIKMEKSLDNSSWTNFTDFTQYYESAEIKLQSREAAYYRIQLYNYDLGVYSQPSNSVLIYPELSDVLKDYNCYYSASPDKAILYFAISKYDINEIDGFKIYSSVNGGSFNYVKGVAAKNYSKAEDYQYLYKVPVTAPSKYGYLVRFKIYPYFVSGGKTYQYNGMSTVDATYVSDSLVTVVTKKDKVVLKLKKLGSARYKIQYRPFNIAKQKNGKTKTVYTTKTKYVIKNKSKTTALTFDITPCWGSYQGETLWDLSSHEGMALLSGSPKVKVNKINVINVKGKKAKTEWTETLTASDKKIIKDFFYDKYKGKNPSRAEMVRYAFNWIHRKVKYDYKYKYGNLPYTKAIFLKKKGQCLQYNGAMAKVLAYLGYESRIIHGTRRGNIQHFWCEVKLGGRWYLVETGNENKNGDWQHFVVLYRDGRGYIKFKKDAKD